MHAQPVPTAAPPRCCDVGELSWCVVTDGVKTAGRSFGCTVSSTSFLPSTMHRRFVHIDPACAAKAQQKTWSACRRHSKEAPCCSHPVDDYGRQFCQPGILHLLPDARTTMHERLPKLAVIPNVTKNGTRGLDEESVSARSVFLLLVQSFCLPFFIVFNIHKLTQLTTLHKLC